jgi:thymidylate synthase (FAD)
MKVELVSITKPYIDGVDSAEDLVAYCARVSNPSNQMNSATAPNLLRYLIKNKHWSPFEMVSMCVSIETSRAMAQQILRHRSFSFQEFSQRYADVNALEDILEPVELRKKNDSNRQSSTDIDYTWIHEVKEQNKSAVELYNSLIEDGIAPETARFVLPLTTKTKMYMSGTLRSWIHYLDLRCNEHTQKEHREVAKQIKGLVEQNFPTVFEAIYSPEAIKQKEIEGIAAKLLNWKLITNYEYFDLVEHIPSSEWNNNGV